MFVNSERMLFELCIPNRVIPEKEKIAALLKNEHMIGVIVTNRVAGNVYHNLKNNDILHLLPREVSNAFKDIYMLNSAKNENYLKCVEYIDEILKEYENAYAMLKGAFLCNFYPSGCRTSNDIDLLVCREDIGKICETLLKNGFVQGYIRNNKFREASREEIIASSIMRGETVPFIKKVNLPFIEYLEIDINFSTDYKDSNTEIVEKMICNSNIHISEKSAIKTLDNLDFFIHLCAHLYKEATTLPWIKMRRDMTLYKYVDIVYLIESFTLQNMDKLRERILELNLCIPCYFAIKSCDILFQFKNKHIDDLLQGICPLYTSFMNEVFDPRNKKIYRYNTVDLCERFFANDRMGLLEEKL